MFIMIGVVLCVIVGACEANKQHNCVSVICTLEKTQRHNLHDSTQSVAVALLLHASNTIIYVEIQEKWTLSCCHGAFLIL